MGYYEKFVNKFKDIAPAWFNETLEWGLMNEVMFTFKNETQDLNIDDMSEQYFLTHINNAMIEWDI